jgi:hypothetical protein
MEFHMSSLTTTFKVEKLSGQKLAAIKRRAREEGISTSEYIKQLIENDLELEREARTKSLQELAEPLHQALKGFSEEQLDALVEKARRTPSGRRRK